jgi:hypothetical protein
MGAAALVLPGTYLAMAAPLAAAAPVAWLARRAAAREARGVSVRSSDDAARP